MIVWLLVAACAPAAQHVPDQDDVGTVGVLVDGTQRRLYLAPYDEAAPAIPLAEGDSDGPLYVLYFPREVALPTGEFVERTPQPWTRLLPTARQAQRRAWDEVSWSDVAPETVPPFSLALEPPATCALRGGCYADEHSRVCAVPCPEPAAPAPPAPPETPRYRPCPAGWIDDAEAFACRAPSGCGPGELYDRGAQACRAPGPPADRQAPWPPGLDEARTRFVRAGAVGGDGSRGSPWGLLAEALARAPAGTTLALSPGVHDAPAALSGAYRLVGVSSSDTRLVSSATVSLDGLTLAALTLDVPHLRTRGEARLEGVLASGSIDADAGALTCVDTVVDGRVRVRAGASVVARDAALSAPTLALVVAGGATGLVEGARLEGGVRAEGALTVRDSALRSVGGPALVVAQSEAQLSGVDLDVTGAPQAVLLLEAASLVGQRVLVGGGQDGIEANPGAAIALEDSAFVEGSTAGKVLGINAFDTRVTLRRVHVTGVFDRAIVVDGAGSRVTIEDFTSRATLASSLDLSAQPPMVLRRARVRSFNSFKSLAAPGTSTPWAVEVEDVYVDGGVLSFRGPYPVQAVRVAAYASGGVAIVSEATPIAPLMELADIYVEGAVMPLGCDPRSVCSGVGIQALGGIRMERFVLRDNAGPALLVADPAGLSRVHGGVVADQRTAVAVEGSRERLWSLLAGVVLRDVEFVCGPCGE